jgi:maleamate amidohydrolase
MNNATLPSTDSTLAPTLQAIAELTEKRGQFKRHGPGKNHAVVVIDMQYFFLRDGDPVSDASVAANRRLLAHARASKIPVFLFRAIYDQRSEINPCWRARFGSFLLRGDPTAELHAGLDQKESDIVVEKKHASAFTGTILHELLSARGIDTIWLTGTSTSGCVRATAVEGAARHYRMMVVEECTFEARPISGPVALYEMADRYADVVSLDEAITMIA